jgi:single-strand DNA-binding protein
MAGTALTIISGKLFKDSEMSYFPDGTAVTKFTLPTGEKYKNSAGVEVDNTVWYNISIRGKRAEHAHRLLTKGTVVTVSGVLRKPNVFTKRDGTPATSLELTTYDFNIISFADGNQGTAQNADVPKFESGESSDAVEEDDIEW